MGFIGFLIILVCVVLCLIVLVQNSKGGGLASNFSSSNQILGVAKTKDILEQITWGAAGVLLLLCLLSTPKTTRSSTTNAANAGAAGQEGQKKEVKLSEEERSETKRMAKAFPSGGAGQPTGTTTTTPNQPK